MRKGRFAGLSDKGQEAVTPPELAELLLFDFTPAGDEDDHRAALDRARSVQLSLPLLAASHALWSAVLIGGLAASGARVGLVGLAGLLVTILIVDFCLWLGLKRMKLRPYETMRLAALHGAVTAALWFASATLVGPEADTLLVKAALIAGAGSAIAVFFTVPLLMVLAVSTTFLVATAMPSDEPILAIGGALSLFLLCLGMARSRQFLFAARQRLALEWQAEKARRFVADFEASGRGWFWETNADGALTYVSEPLAAHLGLTAAELVGRRFEDVLLLDSGDGDDSRRTLGFHLSARFPFADAVVRAPTGDDVWWSLSGSPNFDGYGRFLGFRGLGSNLSEQRRSEAEASKLARYDSLTGLPNRAMMRSMLGQALANADARRRGCALMIIDLDRFKQVNDTLGHPVGDKLLKKVAGRLVPSTRRNPAQPTMPVPNGSACHCPRIRACRFTLPNSSKPTSMPSTPNTTNTHTPPCPTASSSPPPASSASPR